MRTALRAFVWAMTYLGVAFVAPVALIAAPLGLMLALLRPGRRETIIAGAVLGMTAWSITHAASGFPRVEAAWVCLLAGATAVALALRPPGTRPVMSTILTAVGLAAGAAVILVTVTGFSWSELRWLAEHHFGAKARILVGIIATQSTTPETEAFIGTFEAAMNDGVRLIGLVLPGLVLLQSLAALTIGWSLYRWLARHPEGEPLPALREFRFSDHLVWGIVLALIALVLPGGGALRDLGSNLATFFGGLYVLRGVAVLAAMAAAAGAGIVTLIMVSFIVAVLAPLALFTALAIGVTDTWVDWRKRVNAKGA